MLNNMATRSKVLLGFFFVILLTGLGFYGCGTNSSSTLDLPSNSTTAAAIPVSLSAPPLIPVPVVPPSTAITGIAAASAGQVTISAPNTLANGDIVAISGSTNYNGTYTAINPTPPSFTIAAPFVGPLVPSGTTPPVFQPQILATPVTGIAPSTTTPGQVTIVANNTLTEGTPIVITGSSIADLNGPTTAIAPTPTTFSVTTTYVPPPVPPAGTSTTLPAGTTLGVILAGGGVLPVTECKTTTTGTAGAIKLPKSVLDIDTVPSRFAGVAPLAVFFDATATTHTTPTIKAFHDIEYRWGFGDIAGSPVGGTTWANGSRPGISSRNSATGPVAAHVFETPGTYIVNLTATDGTNTVSNSCVQIAVTDPNVVFAAANTVCIANSTATAGSGGCPAGATTPAGTSSFNTALAACKNGVRCLFRGGDTFVANAAGQISSSGPITLGSYGTGTAAITSTNVGGVLALFNSAVNDLRITDLDVAGSGASDLGACVLVGASPTNVTILRLGCHDIGKGIIMASGGNITGSVIQDSHIFNINAVSGGVGIFGWAINSAYLGNFVGPFGTTAEHSIRLQPGQRVAISNNTITTPGTSGKSLLTVRALEHTPDAIDPAVYSAPDTQYVYISDNKMTAGSGSTQMFQIAPAAKTQNNWISDVIAERNWLVFASVGKQGIYTEAVRVTIRNNICDATGGTNVDARACFGVFPLDITGLVPSPTDNWFYNNTCYSSDAPTYNAGTNFQCVYLDATGSAKTITNTVVVNNLAYAPTTFLPKLLLKQGAGVTGTTGDQGDHGNSFNAQLLSTKPWAASSPSNPIDFTPASSYAVGGGWTGGTVPVWSDFFGNARTGTYDIGAVNH